MQDIHRIEHIRRVSLDFFKDCDGDLEYYTIKDETTTALDIVSCGEKLYLVKTEAYFHHINDFYASQTDVYDERVTLILMQISEESLELSKEALLMQLEQGGTCILTSDIWYHPSVEYVMTKLESVFSSKAEKAPETTVPRAILVTCGGKLVELSEIDLGSDDAVLSAIYADEVIVDSWDGIPNLAYIYEPNESQPPRPYNDLARDACGELIKGPLLICGRDAEGGCTALPQETLQKITELIKTKKHLWRDAFRNDIVKGD